MPPCFTWQIVSGAGRLSGVAGERVTYTAPDANSNCSDNPTIRVTDSNGLSGELRIAVNSASGDETAYIAIGQWVSPLLCSGEPRICGPEVCMAHCLTTRLMSRTALDGFPFGDVEKDHFIKVLKRLNKVYFTEIMGICMMGNHFHLLVKMLPETDFSDKDVRKRFERYYGEEKVMSDGQIPSFRASWSSLSEFVKEVKLGFTRF